MACAGVFGAAALILAGCEWRTEPAATQPERAAALDPAGPAPRPLEGSLAWAVSGAWRSPAERTLDPMRLPVEALELADLRSDAAVADLWPGDGWWTGVIAPYVARGGGAYLAILPEGGGAAVWDLEEEYRARFAGDDRFGPVQTTRFDPVSETAFAAPGSLDTVFAMRSLNTLMALGLAEAALAQSYAALKPGGRLVVLEARAREGGAQDPSAASGYVQESFVILLAEEAGFQIDAREELFANPADDGDHPFGVWTLEPYRLTAPLGQPDDPAFDRSAFDAIGAPDRMYLIFRKPAP